MIFGRNWRSSHVDEMLTMDDRGRQNTEDVLPMSSPPRSLGLSELKVVTGFILQNVKNSTKLSREYYNGPRIEYKLCTCSLFLWISMKELRRIFAISFKSEKNLTLSSDSHSN